MAIYIIFTVVPLVVVWALAFTSMGTIMYYIWKYRDVEVSVRDYYAQ